jgi:hypothetical protein
VVIYTIEDTRSIGLLLVMGGEGGGKWDNGEGEAEEVHFLAFSGGLARGSHFKSDVFALTLGMFPSPTTGCAETINAALVWLS